MLTLIGFNSNGSSIFIVLKLNKLVIFEIVNVVAARFTFDLSWFWICEPAETTVWTLDHKAIVTSMRWNKILNFKTQFYYRTIFFILRTWEGNLPDLLIAKHFNSLPSVEVCVDLDFSRSFIWQMKFDLDKILGRFNFWWGRRWSMCWWNDFFQSIERWRSDHLLIGSVRNWSRT